MKTNWFPEIFGIILLSIITALMGYESGKNAGIVIGIQRTMAEAFKMGYTTPIKHYTTIEYQWTDPKLLKDIPPN